MWIPVRSFSSSPAMCAGVPFPTDAYAYRPGSFFAMATMSRSVAAGTPGLAAMSCGTLTISDTGTKSRSTS